MARFFAFCRKSWKLVAGVAILIVAGVVTAAFLYFAWTENARTALLEQAREALRQEEWTAASDLLSQVLSRDPNSEEALRMLLQIAEQKNDRLSVALLLGRLATLDPLDQELMLRYLQNSNDVKRFGDVQSAVARIGKSRQLTPEEQLEGAIAMLGNGNFTDAEELIESGDAKVDSQDERMAKFNADLLLAKGLYDQALPIYVKLGEEASNPVIRAEALLRQATFEAEPVARRKILLLAAQAMPRLGVTALAEFDLGNKDFSAAIADIETLPIEEWAPPHFVAYGEAAAALKDVARLDKAIAANRGRNRALVASRFYLLAMKAFAQKDYLEVLRCLDGALDYQNRVLYKYFQFIALADVDMQNARVVALARELGNSNPLGVEEISVILQRVASQLAAAKQFAAAAEALACVDTLTPNLDAVEDFRLECLIATGAMLQEQHLLADRILRRRPENIRALEISGARDFAQNDWTSGVRKFEILRRQHPQSPGVLQTLAEVAEASGALDQAVELYREGLQLQEVRADLYRALWGFYVRNQRLDDAAALIVELRKAAVGDPELTRMAFYLEAASAEREQKYELARQTLGELRKVDGYNPQIVLFLTQLALSMEDPQQAEKDLREGIAAFPEADGLQAELAGLLARLGRDQEAYELYGKLVERHPDEWLMEINFSETAAAIGRKKEAYDAALHAKNIHPEEPAVSECYAVRLFENGLYEDALGEIASYTRRFGAPGPRLEECRRKSQEAYDALLAELRSEEQPGAER